MSTTKILMVCLGNICRSPLAEGILRDKLPSNSFVIDSAGTANYHINHAPDKRSIKVAKQYNIDISQLKGRQFTIQDFDVFDYIYVMDHNNYKNVCDLARTPEDIKKVSLLLSIDPENPLKEVPDPYYGKQSDFENVYKLLDNACSKLAKQLI